MTKKSSTSVHLRLNEELLKEINLFADKFYFNNRTEAIRHLIAIGLNYHDEADRLMKINKK